MVHPSQYAYRNTHIASIWKQSFNSLTSKGYKVTPKRMQVIDHLWDKQEIPDVEEVWLEIRDNERISWATVHTTVKLLHKLGWLEAQRHGNRKSNYRWRRMSEL